MPCLGRSCRPASIRAVPDAPRRTSASWCSPPTRPAPGTAVGAIGGAILGSIHRRPAKCGCRPRVGRRHRRHRRIGGRRERPGPGAPSPGADQSGDRGANRRRSGARGLLPPCAERLLARSRLHRQLGPGSGQTLEGQLKRYEYISKHMDGIAGDVRSGPLGTRGVFGRGRTQASSRGCGPSRSRTRAAGGGPAGWPRTSHRGWARSGHGRPL